MSTVLRSFAFVGGALALALGPITAAPAHAQSRGYYYEEQPVYRSAPRGYERGSRIERMFEEDDDSPVYRRIPTARERSGSRASVDGYDAYTGRYGTDSRIERYYGPRGTARGYSYGNDDYDARYAGPAAGAGASAYSGRRTVDPAFAKTTVKYTGSEPANTIVIDTSKRYLYLVQGDGTAIRYGVGVGKQGFTWKGTETITSKKEWPDWRPPAEMRERRPELPEMMAGGPDNPLGARALYLGNTLYRIHGSNEPWTIGHAVSSGCIRMTNDDVTDLYERVGVGTVVKVM